MGIASFCRLAASGLLIANEIRGLVLAAPLLVALYQTGGTLMAVWIVFCSLLGIVFSVFAPAFILKNYSLKRLEKQTTG